MQVVIHAGAHITDEDRLVNCLLANQLRLDEIGTCVPSPSSYRKMLRDMLQPQKGMDLSPDTRDEVVGALVQDPATERLVLSNHGFFGTPKMAVSQATLYGAAEDRMQVFRDIFAGDEVHLFMAICNPATCLPAMFQNTNIATFDDYMRGADPRDVRWSEMLMRVRTAHPDLPITVWCNEDLPMIWGEVVREMGGLAPEAPIEGEFTLLEEIMSEAGMKRFSDYMAKHTGMSETQKRRVIAAFLDKFAQDDAIEEELDIPGWTEELIEEITDLYDDDFYAIEAIPGINLITP